MEIHSSNWNSIIFVALKYKSVTNKSQVRAELAAERLRNKLLDIWVEHLPIELSSDSGNINYDKNTPRGVAFFSALCDL